MTDPLSAPLTELLAKAKIQPLSIPGDPAWSQEQAEYDAAQVALARGAINALPPDEVSSKTVAVIFYLTGLSTGVFWGIYLYLSFIGK